MRIAINTRFLLKGKMEGFGWFTYETVKRIVEQHPEHEFYFFFDRAFDAKFIFGTNVTPIVLNPPARHPVLFKIWFNYAVTQALRNYAIDLFFSPDGYLSLKTKVPQVGVIHDLNFEHFPEDLPKSPRNYLKKYFPLFANKAAQLITVSQFSKVDIVKTYGISPDKITVAHNGASDLFKPIQEETKKQIKKKYTQGNDFFIYVGALHPRKNLGRLLMAYDAFKTETKSQTELLIVGSPLWKNKAFATRFDQVKNKSSIHFSGHVSLDVLTELMGSAKALTFVSYFEGFGIPIIEAFKAGTPVLSGNLTSLPEVAGEAALYVDPFSISSIKEGLVRMDSDPQLRDQLIAAGQERGREFSWDMTANIIWDVLQKQL